MKNYPKETPENLALALDLFEQFQTAQDLGKKRQLLAEAVSKIANVVASSWPPELHFPELCKIVSGKHGDATPASLALFAIKLLAESNRYQNEVNQKLKLFHKAVEQAYSGELN